MHALSLDAHLVNDAVHITNDLVGSLGAKQLAGASAISRNGVSGDVGIGQETGQAVVSITSPCQRVDLLEAQRGFCDVKRVRRQLRPSLKLQHQAKQRCD